MKFTNGINGEMKFLFNLKEVLLIADIMMGSDGSNPPEKLDEIYESAISEAMSMILGTICTNLSGVFNSTIEFETPKVEVKLVNSFSDIGISNEALFIEYDFILGSLSTNKAYQLLNLDFANTLIRKLTGETDVKKEEPKAKDVAPKAPAPAPMPQQNSNQAPPPPPPPQQQGNEQYNQQQGYYPPPPQQGYYPPPPPQGYYPPQQPPSNVKEVQFANLNSSMTANQANNIDLIMDIPLQITVELGRTKKRIRDILEYGTNSIIQLDKLAGETVDVLVNNKLIAKGEVVVIDENFGIRISQIVSPEERLNSLR
jgi:flagellar motor switch protein FliN/FliY